MRKKCLFMLIVLTLALVLCGCVRSLETDADFLTTQKWYTENISGISATLEFEGDTGCFTVFDQGEQAAKICGAVAVDSRKFYITSDEYAMTFEFEYAVFNNRAEITYNSQKLVFYPVSVSTEDEVIQ